jgi:aspartate aminotransferase
MVILAEGKSIFINTEIDNNFKITPAQLEAAITPKTKLFMFSSPNNPTGTVYSKDELAALAEVFEKHPQVFILSDEIYEHINFVDKHESIAQFENIKDRVIIINGFSKAFAMTGWRLGYIAANKTIAAANDKLQGQTTSGTCSISQRAGIVAYEQGLESVNKMKEAFARRRQLVYDLLTEIPGVRTNLPEGAFYFFPEISSFFGKKDQDGNVIKNSSDLALYLLNVGHVATVGGDSFGNDNYIRLSYAASDESLIEALKRIKEALGKLA